MTSLGLRARKERSEEFGDLEDEFKARINSLYWVVYFPEDGKPMSLPATYAGIELTLAERALAKVGDSFTVKFTSGRYVAKIKEMGMKSYAEKCVTMLSYACKQQSGEPEITFSSLLPQSSQSVQLIETNVLDCLTASEVSCYFLLTFFNFFPSDLE